MKSEMEVKNLITEAMKEPKAPEHLVEKALAMAREAERSRQTEINKPAPTVQGGPTL